MINPYSRKVNQYLAYVRTQMAAARECRDLTSLDAAMKIQAILHSAQLLLGDVYTLYLREIAASNHLKQAVQVSSLEDLVAVYTEQFPVPAEVEELLQLEAQQGSWLNSYQNTYRHRMRIDETPSGKFAPKSAEASTNIPILDVTHSPESNTLNMENLASWVFEMQALIERQRNSMIEY